MTKAITITADKALCNDVWLFAGDQVDVDAETADALISQGLAQASGNQVTVIKGGPLIANHVLSVGEQLTITDRRCLELFEAGVIVPGWFNQP